jgi:hypothetical protein
MQRTAGGRDPGTLPAPALAVEAGDSGEKETGMIAMAFYDLACIETENYEREAARHRLARLAVTLRAADRTPQPAERTLNAETRQGGRILRFRLRRPRAA